MKYLVGVTTIMRRRDKERECGAWRMLAQNY